MRCRAIVAGTKRDPVVQQCQNPIVFVLPNGRTVKEDPGNGRGGYWSIYDTTHHAEMVTNQANDVRDENGHRAYGPQRILKQQQSDPWTDPVEGGTRWPADERTDG